MSAFSQPTLEGTLHHPDRLHTRTRAAGLVLAVAAALAALLKIANDSRIDLESSYLRNRQARED
jgi:hypothetical protein